MMSLVSPGVNGDGSAVPLPHNTNPKRHSFLHGGSEVVCSPHFALSDITLPLAGGSDAVAAGEGALSGPESPTLPEGE